MNETNFKSIFKSIIFMDHSDVIYQKKEHKKFYNFKNFYLRLNHPDFFQQRLFEI